jgi:hypothetical protein
MKRYNNFVAVWNGAKTYFRLQSPSCCGNFSDLFIMRVNITVNVTGIGDWPTDYFRDTGVTIQILN